MSGAHNPGQSTARRNIAWWIVGTAIASGLSAFTAIKLTQQAGYIAAVWPANGILLAALIAVGRQQAAFIAAAFVANVIVDVGIGQPPTVSVFLSACSSVEMLVAMALMRWYQKGNWIHLEQPRVLAAFWATVCLIAPFVSASLAAIGLHGFVDTSLREVFETWWMANALGLAVMTPPLLIIFRDGARASMAAISSTRAIGSLLFLLVVTSGVFLQVRYPLLFLLFPAMVLVAFNAGFLGVAIALLIVTVESSLLTYLGTGPLTLIPNVTPREITVLMQLVLAQMLIMGFLVAANLGERRKLERELEVLATTDALTGLSTRRRFDEHFQTVWAEALRERHPVAVMMLDADFFKAYNDSYGHLDGDVCIKAIATIIRGIARRPLDLAVRYGGEEFLLLLSHTSLQGAKQLAVEIHEALAAANIEHRESPYGRVTLSIGIAAAVPEADMSATGMIDAADRALYRAKHAGRSRTELANIAEPGEAGD